ncbi:serum response factor-binding protein 1-like [Saccostrea echinata]|uniref:serum response factor-binding protein 1-like n=1 Tax=Saccostrea echinata TaxID=191078 RepID=UPI002A8173C4|nr:serum response factor-binding protein 1-like [Saccostrea echinata]
MNSGESSNDEVEDIKQHRNLDVASTASLDLVALNNKVISMRGQIKKVKVQVIHKLTRQITALQNKERGPEKLLEKNKRKAERLVEEVQVLKDLKPDGIAKYAIGHTISFTDVCREPKASLETKALARLTDHKILQDSVKEFRRDHEDWMSLAAFLMSRNSGRRIKKQKPNRVDKIITNVKAGEVLVKSYLQNRLEGEEEGLDKVQKLNAGKKNPDNSKQEHTDTLANPSFPGDGGGSDMESGLNEEESEEYSEEDSFNSEELSGNESEKLQAETLPKSIVQRDSVKSSTKTSNKNKQIHKKEEKQDSKNSEMVIKKLNMDDLDSESEIPTDSVPSFLTGEDKSKSPDTETKRHKKKDAFFVTSDDSDGEDEDDNPEDSYRLKGDNSDEEEEELERGKHAFRSTFLGSLSEKDWRRSTKERNEDRSKKATTSQSFTNFQKNKRNRGFPNNNPKQNKQLRSKETQDTARKDVKNEKLHPSWIASKKRKEQAQIKSFQGKKIKFDD